MRISGFSFVRNGEKLHYPIKQAIESILPIVDEFVVALGAGDADDYTGRLIERINSDKIRIIHTEWDLEQFPNGTENAHQTDIAMKACTGDWLFYLQADEVVHERFLPVIKSRCAQLLHDAEVEGLLFSYRHFWGDFDHYIQSHGWYDHEIRIVRNRPDIHSWESAQSFRVIPRFDGKNYRQHPGSRKLKVAAVDASIYHYGWVRPPVIMEIKRQILAQIHGNETSANEVFQYGDMRNLKMHSGTHPACMEDWIEQCDWENDLDFDGAVPLTREKFKHERWRYKMLTWIEQKLLGGRQIGGYKNYRLLRR